MGTVVVTTSGQRGDKSISLSTWNLRQTRGMTKAHSNGITIEYEVHGEGEPLLLVMGLGGQLVSWPVGFVDGLVKRGFQVITFDNRDVGLSTKGMSAPMSTAKLLAGVLAPRLMRSEYVLSDMANDAVGLLDALGIASAHVMGISMGGMISQSIAIGHPSRVRSLTSIMSTTGNRRVGQPSIRLVWKMRKLIGGPQNTAIESGVELFRLVSGSSFDEAEARSLGAAALARDFDPDGTARQTAAIMASHDRTEALCNVRIPALVIHGLEDPLVKPSGGMATARAIPGARLLMFPDMGHNLPARRWPEILDAIEANTLRAIPSYSAPELTRVS